VSADRVLTVAVVTAGMGIPSATGKLGDRIGEAVTAELAGRGVEARVVRIEVREVAHEAVNAALTQVAGPALQQALDDVAAADAVVAVTPVWNGAASGLFKLFFDVLDQGALSGKPMVLGATGGTARHSLAIDQSMLPMFWMLKARPVPTPVFAATEEWGQASGLSDRIERAAADLADALTAVAPRPADDPFDDVPDFRTMLGLGASDRTVR